MAAANGLQLIGATTSVTDTGSSTAGSSVTGSRSITPAASTSTSGSGDTSQLRVLMPDRATHATDAYLCTSVPLDDKRPLKLVGFDPIAEMGTVHHMLVFGARQMDGGGSFRIFSYL